jgi:hypothetical protein
MKIFPAKFFIATAVAFAWLIVPASAADYLAPKECG